MMMMNDRTAAHSDEKTEQQEWLWPGRIPLGHLTLIGGVSGAGKSITVSDIVARVTIGRAWPDGTGKVPEGNVLVISEDAVSTMQNPRLLAADADLTKIRHWRGTFSIERDLEDLEAAIKAHRVRLVILDPLQDFLAANSYHGVRDVLTKLRNVAARTRSAILCMGHPPKGLPAPADSFGGSRGIPTVARAFWFVTEDGDNGGRLLLRVKCNVGEAATTGLRFRIETRQVAVGRKLIEAPAAVWDEVPVTMDANDWWYVAKGAAGRAEPRRALDGAFAFLEEFLEDGPKLADEVQAEAARHGHKRGTLHAARLRLNLRIEKQTGVAHGPWKWSLPDQPRSAQPEPKKVKRNGSRKGKRAGGSNIIPFPPPKAQDDGAA